MKIIDYKLECEFVPADLSTAVKEDISNGWQPMIGGHGVAIGSDSSIVYTQVMIKTEEGG